MNVLGIIAEYNPFHNGHLHHLKRSVELTGADVTVAVMSGNFVQRGEPAVTDKWIRSEMAVRNGVDLVLELPFAYSCNNAELFASGSVGLLDGLGCVSSLCFGSETGETESLWEIAGILSEETESYSEILKEKLKEGISFPKARQETVAHFLGENKAAVLESPNNILGIEYLKQLKIRKSKIKPYTIRRAGARIDEANPDQKIAGATAIRNMLDDGDFEGAMMYLPAESRQILESFNGEPADIEMFKELIIYSIISKSQDELSDIYSVTEGLENKISQSAKESASIRELIESIKSKRYTQTRIKRILIHILTGLKRQDMLRIMNENQMYARVLSFNDKGAALLKKIKNEERSKIPIITNISKERDMLGGCRDLFSYDVMASDIYNLAVHDDIYGRSDYRRVPAYVK